LHSRTYKAPATASIPPQAHYDPPNFLLVIPLLFPLLPSPFSSCNGLWVYSNGRDIQADNLVSRSVSVNPNDCEFKGESQRAILMVPARLVVMQLNNMLQARGELSTLSWKESAAGR
jgi:hypothetical protein